MENNLNILNNTPSLNEDALDIVSEYYKESEKDNNILGNIDNTTDIIDNISDGENRLATFLENDSEGYDVSEDKVEECTALVTVKERRIMTMQTMFKRSIKVTIKSFLISLSLSFLNFFI